MRDVANLRVECSIQWRVYEEERVCLVSMHVGAKETEREGEGGRKREVRRPEIDKRAAFIELDLSGSACFNLYSF